VSQALLICQACGYEENADKNAAKNIKTVGQTGIACEANRRSGRQQEPAGIREEALPVASKKPVEPKLTRSFASSNPLLSRRVGCQEIYSVDISVLAYMVLHA